MRVNMIKKRGFIIILAIILLVCMPVSVVSATTISDTLEKFIQIFNISDGDQSKEITSIRYEEKIYMPIQDIASIFGKKIVINGNNIDIIDEKVEEEMEEPFKLKDDFLLYGFYAIKSYEQFDDFYRGKTLSNFDSLSFGWSRIEKVGKSVKLIFDGHDYYVPNGYDKTLKKVNELNIPNQLMVHVDDNTNKNDYFKEIFQNGDKIIDDIVKTVNGKNTSYKKLVFDGVTIDFENVNIEDQDQFIVFLKKLRVKLGQDKTIHVALPSIKYYSYYKHKEIMDIVDYVILMEHDFEIKNATSRYYQFSESPLSPFETIKKDIETLLEKVGPAYSNKIILQVNFSVAQWIGYKGSPFKRNPSAYNLLYNRICEELDKENTSKEELLGYHDTYQNPYLIYINDKKETNFIWYENWNSVLAKIKLANDYDLAGVSLWRIGTIPNYYGKYGKEVGFDIWYQINELINK